MSRRAAFQERRRRPPTVKVSNTTRLPINLIRLRTTAAERREEAELRDLFCKEPSSAVEVEAIAAAEEVVEAAEEEASEEAEEVEEDL
jgi:hypothetical protein